MASRRNRSTGADAFGEGQDYSLADVDSALFGGIRRADASKVSVRPVDPRLIKIDQKIQVRVRHLDLERVEMLRAVMINGGDFHDPIVVCRDQDDQLWLADGFHRVEAYLQAMTDPAIVEGKIDLRPLRAEIRPGDYDAAMEYSEEANLKHGAPLSSDDKKNLYWRRLARGYYAPDVNLRDIAKTLGVVHTTISRWRQEYLESVGANAPHEKPKRSKKSKKRNAGQIKKSVITNLTAAADALEKLNRIDLADGLRDWLRQLQDEGVLK